MFFANKCGVKIRGEAVPPRRAKRLGSKLNQIVGLGRKARLPESPREGPESHEIADIHIEREIAFTALHDIPVRYTMGKLGWASRGERCIIAPAALREPGPSEGVLK
jgi:hypothetical protein